MSSKEDYVVNGRFKVIKKLGIGAQGKVYKVEDLNDSNKNKAIKEIKVNSSEELESVKREVNILQKIDSPYILKYLDYSHDTKNGFFYILTEIYEDGTLEQIISKNKSSNKLLEFENVLIWSLQLLRGIDYLHSKSIIHRDIKPQNIFLHRFNLVLGDLGLAKDANILSAQSITKGIGTMAFMAPEIFENKKYDNKIDIWAFGCVLYEMIKLEKIFDGTILQITSAISNFKHENLKLESVPDLFQAILIKSILKSAENRSNAKELIELIKQHMFHKQSSNQTSTASLIKVVEAESEFWDACNVERDHYNGLFDQLSSGSEYLSGEKAKEFLKKSELDDEFLNKLWNLVDFNKDGKLDKKEFGVACFLIKKAITDGQNTLPLSVPAHILDAQMELSELGKSTVLNNSTTSISIDSVRKKDPNKLKELIISSCNKKIKFYDFKTGKLEGELEGHKKDISSLKVIDSNKLASGSHDKIIKLWSVQTGECLNTLEGHQWSVTNLEAISNESNKLLISSSQSEIKIWNIETGELIKTLIEYASGIQNILVLNEDTIASSDVDGLIKIWNLSSKKCVNTIEAHKGKLAPYSVKCLHHIKDEILASGSKDKKIKIWNFKAGKCLDTLEGVFSGHTATVRCLAQPTDNVLVSGSSDRTIKLWNLKTSKCVKTLKGHTDKVTNLVANSSHLISGSDDGLIKIWNIITGECINTIQNSFPVNCLQIFELFGS